MLELLPSVQEPNDENSKRANLSWKGKLAILLLYNENSLSLESIASNLTEVVRNPRKKIIESFVVQKYFFDIGECYQLSQRRKFAIDDVEFRRDIRPNYFLKR